MPCLIAQAICFIHIFGLQLCVAMNEQHRSGSPTSIQNPLNNPEVVVLQVVPRLRTSEEDTGYYVTTVEINGKRRLKLTKRISDALPIGKSAVSGVDLPALLSDFTCDDDGNMHVEARRTQDLGQTQDPHQTRAVKFFGGKIEVPPNQSLYREIDTDLLVVKRGELGENLLYEQMVQSDPSYLGNCARFTTSPTAQAQAAECNRVMPVGGITVVASIPLLFSSWPHAWGLTSAIVVASAQTVTQALRNLREIRDASEPQKLVWMDLDGNSRAGPAPAQDNIGGNEIV